MTTTNPPFSGQISRSWQPTRRSVAVTAAIAGAVLLIAAVSVYFSPIGRRWQANQTAAIPVVGVTDVEIVADATLNHIFAPSVIQVAAGETVTWHFQDVDEDGAPVEHNIVFQDGPAALGASPIMDSGTFAFVFDEPGTYDYVCTLHAFMNGRVIVTP